MRHSSQPTARTRLVAILRGGIVRLSAFTFVVDLLLLVQPLYMLQIYDRVLTSASVETLVFTSVIACAALLLLGVVDTIRSALASRLAAKMDVDVGADTLLAAMSGPRAGLGDVQPLRDLGIVRGFIANRGILAFLDLPFAPLFIGILYVIHPHLFFLTVGGAAVLTVLALLNQAATSRASSGEEAMAAMLSAQSFAKSAESIHAMGMGRNVVGAWGREEAAALRLQGSVNDVNAAFAGVSRVVRLGQQIAILGYGGYLVIDGQMTAGMIFAASLISGRGLQPIDQVIAGWKGFVETRLAWKRLATALDRSVADAATTELPAPRGEIRLERLVVHPPNATGGEALLKRISATFAPGECIAVTGPSGAGKSTLARAIVGAIRPQGGVVRVDGADIRTWPRDRLGRHFGYLSQDVDLLPGTVAENIARFDSGANDADIVAAAEMAQVHSLILGLPEGYDTVIGPAGQQLSGGQRQRIGLARAFFGGPRMLVLDEPNANLDTDGEIALDRAMARAKQDGITVIVVTQRRPVAERADKIMILRDGMIDDFGSRAEVFARQAQKAKAAQEAARNQPTPIVSGRFGPATVVAATGE